MREVIAVAAAGAVGALGRWALSGWLQRVLGERFPYGTLAVNVLGCLLLGLLMELALASDLLPRPWRVPLTAGFLGAFTTFSTFGYETMRLLRAEDWSAAAANVGANLVLGFTAVWLGFHAARLITS